MGIGAKERVSRSLSLRYVTLREQEKLARYDGDSKKVQYIKERIESTEKIAIDLGFPLLRDRKKQRKGIAQTKPDMTTLIEKQFRGMMDGNLYRILSGVAHSDYAILQELSFVKTDLKKPEGALLIKAVPTHFQSALVSLAARVYAKCTWIRTIQLGIDAAKIAVLLEELYDELKLADTNNDRFWRTLIKNRS